MSWTPELDPHYDRPWSEFERGLAARQVLDSRTRLLVLIGECVVFGETDDVAALSGRSFVRRSRPQRSRRARCGSRGGRQTDELER
jgi:hypothetical protein